MADAPLQTIDISSVAENVKDVVRVLKRNVRGRYSHLKRGFPDLSHLPREDQDRIHNFMNMETHEDVEEFKIWIRSLPDPNGVLMRRWEHNEMHEWLLLSHAANNAQTGTGMGLVESFIQYEILDTLRATEIEMMLS
ncbi:hypothetical protein MVEN_00107700 [Mycena venus]|uniref:Uncharacterized protein n=1 Tax=Mycena venus TaxID=2733690 RepID=A0A8H7DIE5_9AGAR|nr:hypothetical protein MVEN_00107700 [Mycena venus]